MTEPPITMNVKEAAEFLRVSVNTIREWAATGIIPGAKLGKHWVFIREDLIGHLRSLYKAQVHQPSAAAIPAGFPVRPTAIDALLPSKHQDYNDLVLPGIPPDHIRKNPMEWLSQLSGNTTLTPDRVAAAIGWTAEQLTQDRRGPALIPFEQYGRTIRYRVRDVRRFLEQTKG